MEEQRAENVTWQPQLDTRLDSDDLKLQWRKYNKVLEEMQVTSNNKELSSLDLMKLLIDPKKMFRGIEGVLSVLVRAAVAKGGVESVCESMVCVMEAHTPSLSAIINQERLEDEVMVAWNGEDVFHCDAVVKEALDSYWGKCKMVTNRGGHFIRRSDNINSYIVSEAVDSQVKKHVKLSTMTDQ